MNKVLVSLLLTLGLTGVAQAAGDAEAGQGKVAVCGACHGADGNSPAPNFPKLAGQGERYLLKQLHDIKSGARPVVEMTGMLDNLSEQDMADIAAYFSSQKMSVGAADPKLVERGEALFRGGKLEEGMPSCIGCHSPNGAGLAAAGFPHLGGQHAQYVAKQLTDFREGNRTNDGDAMIMRAIAAKPDILLMDEPFSALDPLARASLQETVSLIHKKLGTTIVFVTHDMNEAAKLACRIGVMHQGRLVQVDTPQDIQNHPADDYVRSLFGAAQPENTISADKVINLYRRLDADGKARVREYWAQNRMDV